MSLKERARRFFTAKDIVASGGAACIMAFEAFALGSLLSSPANSETINLPIVTTTRHCNAPGWFPDLVVKRTGRQQPEEGLTLISSDGNNYISSGRFPEKLTHYFEIETQRDSGINSVEISIYRGVIYSSTAEEEKRSSLIYKESFNRCPY